MALYAERNIVSFVLLTGFMCFEGRNVRKMLESTRFRIALLAGFPDRHPALGVARSPRKGHPKTRLVPTNQGSIKKKKKKRKSNAPNGQLFPDRAHYHRYRS